MHFLSGLNLPAIIFCQHMLFVFPALICTHAITQLVFAIGSQPLLLFGQIGGMVNVMADSYSCLGGLAVFNFNVLNFVHFCEYTKV